MQSFSQRHCKGKKHLENVREMTISWLKVYTWYCGPILTGLICIGIKTSACLCCQLPMPTRMSSSSLVSQLLFSLRKYEILGALTKRQVYVSPRTPAPLWAKTLPFKLHSCTHKAWDKARVSILTLSLLLCFDTVPWVIPKGLKINPSVFILFNTKLMLIAAGFRSSQPWKLRWHLHCST